MLRPFLVAPFRTAFRFALMLLFAAGFASGVFAASAKKAFDVAAGDASETLKRFAQQAGQQIVYPANEVRGITTNAVAGEFTVEEGIERLLAGTALKAVFDAGSGSLAVSRAGEAAGSGAASKAGERPRSRNSGRTASVGRGAPTESGRAELGSGSITGRIQNVVTGQYLANARVSIQGTGLTALTDEDGVYHLHDVPAGDVVLEVFYTGLDPRQIQLAVAPGKALEQDVALTNVKRYGESEQLIKMGEFVVTTAKEVEGAALATNEQRFAANIKNVVSTDAYGDITAGNVAEFMRFLPGVAVNYEDAMPMTVSVRGFADNLTNVSIDGDQTANAVSTGGSRVFQFKQVSINNTSRIEVTKVPTPADPASSLAGSINMVSKSAFERNKAQFNYKVYLAGNGDALTLRKTAYVEEKKTYKILPAFDFDYTLPISKNFGLVLTGLTSDQFNNQNHSSYSFGQSGTGPGASAASPAKPIVSAYAFIDAPKYLHRDSVSLKADWRVTPHSVLSVSGQATYYRDDNGNYTMTATTGTNGTPTTANGVPLSYGDNFTIGATGRGAVTQSGLDHHISGATTAESLRYRFNDGNWRVDANVGSSQSRSWRRYLSEGNFNQMLVSLKDPARVTFEDVGVTRPGRIRAFDNNNREIDLYDIHSYRVTGADEASWGNIRDNFDSGSLNVRRSLSIFGVPSAVQIGGRDQLQKRRVRLAAFTYTYNNADQDAGPFLTRSFRNRESYWGWNNIPWASPYVAYELWQQNPALFSMTPAQVAASEIQRINNTLDFNERTSALYSQFEFNFLNNRLRLLTGVRWEKTADEGAGPSNEPSNVFVRNADGTFARDAAGNRIRRPDAGAAGSLEEVRLTRKALGTHSKRSYDGYYPSVHLTYSATENFLVRAAYARTYGRPDLGSVIPNITITQNDPGAGSSLSTGSINVRNPGLKPWTADNYDLSLEYYTKQGGLFTAGVFRKDITDFISSFTTIATLADLTPLDLDERYVGWSLTTTRNVGEARVSGVELNARQSLGTLGPWGRYFDVFANATRLKLQGSQEASFSGFLPRSANWGFTFTKKPVVLTAKWNYRGLQRLTSLASYGPGAFQYWKARTQLDVNLDYQFSKRLAFFAIARNVLNGRSTLLGYGPQTPEYAKQLSVREYGVQLSAGIKGSF
jgi:TonB-dependent receptor